MFQLCLVFFLYFTYAENILQKNQLQRKQGTSIKEDAYLPVPELITKYHYAGETHTVETSDGYFLSLHRIPRGSDVNAESKGVVFLMHGLLSSSAEWIITGTEKGLGYILADEGYDVWMGNSRGNRYSRKHRFLNTSDTLFWHFSFHEIGVIDLPAMIDYILDHTKQKKLFYVGFSQGTTTFYIMCSENPEYNKKIIAHFSLAPLAYMKHVTSPLMRLLSSPGASVKLIERLIGVNEFLPSKSFLVKFGPSFCQNDNLTQVLCTNAVFALCGFSKDQLDTTLFPVVMGHTPSGSSTKQILHYAQLIKSGRFCKWDYGRRGNPVHYGLHIPPSYKLSNVQAPGYLFWSKNDWLSNPLDVNLLRNELGNAELVFVNEKFNHLDYLYGKEAPAVVYNRVLSIMTEKYRDY